MNTTSMNSSASIGGQQNLPLGVRITIVAYCYILPTICFLGIVGNVMNMVTLASRRLRAVSYMYLRALALADLLCMLFVLAFVSGEVLNQMGIPLNQQYWYGFYQTHLMLSLINWALAAGVYIVLALSLERYISVVFPMHFRQWNSPQRAMRAIFIAFAIPATLYLPYALMRYSIGQKNTPDGEAIVYMAVDSEISKTFGWKIYKWSREGLLRFLPIVMLSVLNFQIMIAFRRRQKMFARLKNREQSKDSQLLYILGGIVVMFFVCNIPAAINLLFINETVKKRLDYQIFRAVANLLEITNHAAQFYVFVICSTEYRITFMRKFPLPCFQSYVINKAKFLSLMRRETTRETVREPGEYAGVFQAVPSSTNNNDTEANGNKVVVRSLVSTWRRPNRDNRTQESTQFSSDNKKSTTATAEICSIVACDQQPQNTQPVHEDQATVDIQLASGEEDISDDSDVLLRATLLSIGPPPNHTLPEAIRGGPDQAGGREGSTYL